MAAGQEPLLHAAAGRADGAVIDATPRRQRVLRRRNAGALRQAGAELAAGDGNDGVLAPVDLEHGHR